MSNRIYKVWIIGQRVSTETTISAVTAQMARIQYSARLGLKSYRVDAKWLKRPTE